MVRALLSAKADLAAATNEGFSPLHVACLLGHAAAAKAILDERKNRPAHQAPSLATLRDKKGRRPVDVAVPEMRFMYLFVWA